MIRGSATPAGTERACGAHGSDFGSELGRTGLVVSPAGFGGYRVSPGVRAHGAALQLALTAGINLIDTSANYADGGSEELIGQVLGHLIDAGAIRREAVAVVSKAGYLQGKNFALSRERRRDGRAFPELVPYAEGLEHCIHPDFLEDQLTRSLARLNLETLDLYLLHNPEYFLGWAAAEGMAPDASRHEYERRIGAAFRHLEAEAAAGRIMWYGISSNTFPADPSDPRFTCLERIWEIAASISPAHRFAAIQLPMNLYEPGAVLCANQPGGESVLQFARRKELAVLINRPLNAMAGGRLLRLAEVNDTEILPVEEITARIETLADSEHDFLARVLPGLGLDKAIGTQLTHRLFIAASLAGAWRELAGYDHWQQVRNELILPRVTGAMAFLENRLPAAPAAAAWKELHLAALDAALRGVGGFYAQAAAAKVAGIRAGLAAADPDWDADAPLSRLALRALRTTAGVSCVLVGMRRPAYVEDVLAELAAPVPQRERSGAWRALSRMLQAL